MSFHHTKFLRCQSPSSSSLKPYILLKKIWQWNSARLGSLCLRTLHWSNFIVLSNSILRVLLFGINHFYDSFYMSLNILRISFLPDVDLRISQILLCEKGPWAWKRPRSSMIIVMTSDIQAILQVLRNSMGFSSFIFGSGKFRVNDNVSEFHFL